MVYILDTNAIIDIQTGHPEVASKVVRVPMQQLATTVITVEEQLSGWYTLLRRARTEDQIAYAYQRLAENTKLLGQFQILSFSIEAIRLFEELRNLKLGVKHMDLRIAAIALEAGGTLVTSNTRDFKDIPHLKFEDWRVATA